MVLLLIIVVEFKVLEFDLWDLLWIKEGNLLMIDLIDLIVRKKVKVIVGVWWYVMIKGVVYEVGVCCDMIYWWMKVDLEFVK